MNHQTISLSDSPSDVNTSCQLSRRALKIFAAATLRVILLFISGATFTATVVAFIMATPLIILFSPILVPVGFSFFLIASGFLLACGCGVVAIATLSWIFKYPSQSDRIDYASDMEKMANDFGLHMQGMALDVTQGA